jgi:CSLREA domain-containing protein
MGRRRVSRKRRALQSNQGRRKRSSQPQWRRLRFEPLEDRRLLSITVDTLVDENNGINVGGISLRDAIAQANVAPDADTIDFAPALTASGPATLFLMHDELAISSSLTINGPGAELLTINAVGLSRIFNIDDGSPTLLDVEIGGLTLTRGTTDGPGGTIFSLETLTLVQSIITNSSASGSGGAIYTNSDLAVVQSIITNSSASGSGGAIFTIADLAVVQSNITGNHTATNIPTAGGGGIYSSGNTLTVLDSVISNNTGSNSLQAEGGGIRKRHGSLIVERSTISGNSVRAPGGGISAADSDIDIQIRDSTISGNTASQGGGVFAFDGSLTITGSTISDNETTRYGGGIRHNGVAILDHAIVAGNRSEFGYGDDVSQDSFNSDGDFTARYTLIGNVTGATIIDNGGNLIGTSISPIDPLLGPLADNGGPTQTHALLPGSPAINRGDTAAVAGVGGVPLFDQRGDPFARIEEGRIDMGAIELIVPAMLVVDTLADEIDGNHGAGEFSLREAIGFANISTDAETITFHPSLTSGGPATLTLTGGDLEIRNSMTINGPGAPVLTIDASGNDPTPTTNNGDGSRVFTIFGVVGGSTVTISGLTLTGGDAGSRGGAVSNSADLTLTRVTISGNSAGTPSTGGHGGGIANSSGNLIINGSTISGNSTVTGGNGGGIHSHFGSMTITGSTISGNSTATSGFGGGIYSGYTATTIDSSTISGNSAQTGGGVVQNGIGYLMTITNSTISGNSARLDGGGAVALHSQLTLRHSTITANRSDSDDNASGNGGGVFVSTQFSQASANHTIVSGNFRGGSTPNDVQGVLPAQFSLIGHAGPLLGSLADNGGPTQSHALLNGSPAIDAGNSSAVAGVGGVPSFDQRGAPFTRVHGGRIDIGAFELQPAGPALPGDYNQDGSVNAADYVVWRKTLGNSVANYDGADGSGNGAIGPEDYPIWTAGFGVTSMIGSIEAAIEGVAVTNRPAIVVDVSIKTGPLAALLATEAELRSAAIFDTGDASLHSSLAQLRSSQSAWSTVIYSGLPQSPLARPMSEKSLLMALGNAPTEESDLSLAALSDIAARDEAFSEEFRPEGSLSLAALSIRDEL